MVANVRVNPLPDDENSMMVKVGKGKPNLIILFYHISYVSSTNLLPLSTLGFQSGACQNIIHQIHSRPSDHFWLLTSSLIGTPIPNVA